MTSVVDLVCDLCNVPAIVFKLNSGSKISFGQDFYVICKTCRKNPERMKDFLGENDVTD